MNKKINDADTPSKNNTAPSAAIFGRRKFVTVSALAQVMQEIKEYGLPTATSRSGIKRARDTEFDETSSTSYGQVIRPINVGADASGAPLQFWIAEPRSNLYYMINKSTRLESFILATLKRQPCSMNKPWTLILYNDEIVAGNPLLPHNHRKVHAHYYSFLEFGAHALSSEFLWFTLCVAKSDSVSSMTGYGAGTLLKEMLLLFRSFSIEGFVCGQVIIWATVNQLISDEMALKLGLDVKGASGHMCCLKCRNMVSVKAYNLAKRSCDLIPVYELDTTKFDAHTDETFVANAKHLLEAKPTLTAAKFAQLETSLGLNFAPDGVLLCASLDFKLSTVALDFQHIYFVHGIFNVETGMLLDRMKREPVRHRVRYSQIHAFFQDGWTWPFNHRHGMAVFETRSSEGGPLQCAASEGLGCFALLQVFLSLIVFDDARDHVKAAICSYYALCKVIELLTMTTRGTVTPKRLMDAMLHHLKLHQSAYGVQHWKPKMHWCLHLPAQLKRYGFLVACFTHERKHKEVKRYMQGRMNTNLSFEKNVLQDVLHIQQTVLNEEHPYPSGTCLLGPRPATPAVARWVQSECVSMSSVLTSQMAKASNHTTVHVNDVACITWDNDSIVVAQVFVLCSIDDHVLAGVRCWPKTPQHNVYSMAGPTYLVHVHDIIDVCIYKLDGQNSVAYVVPPRGVAVP